MQEEKWLSCRVDMFETLGRAVLLDLGIFLAIASPLAIAGVLSFASSRSVSFLVPAGSLVGAYAFAATYGALGSLGAGVTAVAMAAMLVLLVSQILYAIIPWSIMSTRFMVATFGLFFIATNVASILFGDEAVVAAPPSYRTVAVGGANVPETSLVVIGLSVAGCVVAYLVLRASGMSLRIRAMFEDSDLARSLALSTRRTTALSFGISGVLAGFTGVLLIIESNITPSIGIFHFLIALPAILASAGSWRRMACILAALAIGRQIVLVAFGLNWEPAVTVAVVLVTLGFTHYRATTAR